MPKVLWIGLQQNSDYKVKSIYRKNALSCKTDRLLTQALSAGQPVDIGPAIRNTIFPEQ